VTAIGFQFLRAVWSPVTNAGGYVVRYSTDETFATNTNSVNVDHATTAVTLYGLQANTTYYVGVKALGSGNSMDSPFSAAQSATTGIFSSGEDETVMHLQNWMNNLQTEFQNVAMLVPQLETTELNSTERRRLNGSGVRRYGFIEKVFEVSGDFPQFWPPFGEGREEMNQYVHEIDVLRNLLIWFRTASRVVQDLLLIAGNNAFRVAGVYYTFASAGARKKNPDAVQVYNMLRLFWKRPRRITQEPTKKEVERDTRGLLRGTKDGKVSITRESPQVIGGKLDVFDDVQSCKRKGKRAECKAEEIE